MQNATSPIKLHIVLENIRSAFNVGSVFRTADAVGDVMIHLCGITSNIDNPKINKTALGSTESVQSRHYPNPIEATEWLKEQGIPIFSVELTNDAEHFQQIDYPSPLALVFGHEINGVSSMMIENSEKTVYIPMNGIKESLNVANTAAIMMFEATRQKEL